MKDAKQMCYKAFGDSRKPLKSGSESPQGGPERPLHEAVKMKTELSWRSQDRGISTEKSCRHRVKLAQKRGQICLGDRAREAGWSMAVGT